MFVPGHRLCWSGPWSTDWLPGVTLDLPHHYGPACWSLDCVWPRLWLLDLILTLTCRLTSWLDFGPAILPQTCLIIWTLDWAWLPSLGLPLLPWLLISEIIMPSLHCGHPQLPARHLLGSNPALTVPWHSKSRLPHKERWARRQVWQQTVPSLTWYLSKKVEQVQRKQSELSNSNKDQPKVQWWPDNTVATNSS